MIASDIKLLHVESSSRCNAWCPACPRNKFGFGLADGLVETDLDVERFQSVVNQLPNLEIVQLCGNYGDPIAGNNLLPMIDFCIQQNLKIQIHTNGGLRSIEWWEKLGLKLKNVPHDVWFGIDGIGETHEIYRQGTDYNKVISNATAFINAGGTATWQFIPYEHNQKQVLEALKLSQQLKFEKFKLVKLFRKNRLQVQHWKTGEPFELKLANDLVPLIRVDHKRTAPTVDQCMHLSAPSVYLDAQGHISWCCYRSNEQFETVEDLLIQQLNLNNSKCVNNCS
jgi:MoaA/NifB/PqqE/SkfB family radical SAM enzyme